MANFKTNDQVSWVKKMDCVPHPEGKTDYNGNVLPVFRDTQIFGRIISKGQGDRWWVRPQMAEAHKDRICGERYFDVHIDAPDLTLID